MFAITDRLLLRPGWPEDAPALARAIDDWAIVRNTARMPWPYAIGDAERFLALEHAPARPQFLIFPRASGGLIGGIGIFGADVPELGYWLARDAWGRGLATEAGRAVMTIADETLRLPRVEAGHAVDNPASGRVLAKLGFVPTGATALRHSLARGGDVPVRLYERGRVAAALAA